MQMVQRKGGESVIDEDCGEKEEWCMVVRWEKRRRSGAWLSDGRRGNVCLCSSLCVCVAAGYLVRVLL